MDTVIGGVSANPQVLAGAMLHCTLSPRGTFQLPQALVRGHKMRRLLNDGAAVVAFTPCFA